MVGKEMDLRPGMKRNYELFDPLDFGFIKRDSSELIRVLLSAARIVEKTGAGPVRPKPTDECSGCT